jgi:hypothetical protein
VMHGQILALVYCTGYVETGPCTARG